MKRLTVLRHGQADDPVSGQQDWERPLTRRGQHDVITMAQRLKAQQWRIPLILSSPALRTRQTTDLVGKVFTTAVITPMEELYLASQKQLLKVIHAHGGSARHLLLIGHNPGLCELASALSAERSIDNLPTASWVSVEFDLQDWGELKLGTGLHVEFDYPQRCS